MGSDIPFYFSNGAANCPRRGEVVQDLPQTLPTNLPMVLIKPQESCPTAKVSKRLHLGKTSSVGPMTLIEKYFQCGISQDVCINDLEPPAFDVLSSLKRLKQHTLAAGHVQYIVVFLSGSGSSIIGISSPYPPQCVNDEDEHNDIFISEASFLTVCHDFLAFSIPEININDVEVYGNATGCVTRNIFTTCVKISGLNLIDKANLRQCPQAVRRNINKGFDTKFVGLGDKPVGTSIIVMIQANMAKENAEDDGTQNTLINMLFGGLELWSGNPIMFSRYDTSISEITPDRTTEEGRHASNLFFALSACNTMMPLVVDTPDPTQKLIDY